jgi:hypothetical protein
MKNFWKIKIFIILFLITLMSFWVSAAYNNWTYENLKIILVNRLEKQFKSDLSEQDLEKIVQIVDKELKTYWIDDEFDKENQLLQENLKKYIMVFLAILYAFLYCLTIKQILVEHHLVSSASFLGFSLTNFGLWLSNWFYIWSMWYFTAFFMGATTVILNEIIKRKLVNWELIPKIPKRRATDK